MSIYYTKVVSDCINLEDWRTKESKCLPRKNNGQLLPDNPKFILSSVVISQQLVYFPSTFSLPILHKSYLN